MARGRKTGGRQKGTRNRATEEARTAVGATGTMPLDYMLSVMRDAAADHKRRDAMAMAAFRLHDVRRSVATGMARIGISIPVIERGPRPHPRVQKDPVKPGARA
jgi:hypothetical protein